MVQAWYYDETSDASEREPHQHDPPRPVSLDDLSALGVLHWTFDVSSTETLNARVEALMVERDYKNRDVV
jgi:hypothetical protein